MMARRWLLVFAALARADECAPRAPAGPARFAVAVSGDVRSLHDFGFDGVKIDSCGVQRNMTLYAELFNRTGRPILIENCHQGQ